MLFNWQVWHKDMQIISRKNKYLFIGNHWVHRKSCINIVCSCLLVFKGRLYIYFPIFNITSKPSCFQYQSASKDLFQHYRHLIKKKSHGYDQNMFRAIFLLLSNLSLSLYIYIYIRGSSNKFPDFFRMGTFIW